MTPEQIVGRVTDLRVKPVKSCGDLEVVGHDGHMTPALESARLTMSGLETMDGVKDHWFMFVQAEPVKGVYQKITQRDKRDNTDRPQGLADLARIKPQFAFGNLYLSWERRDHILVPLDDDNGKEIPVQIWDDLCLGVDQGNAIAQWASDHLNYKVRLVKAAGSFFRKASQSYMPSENLLRFQDGYPIHWFPHESVSELNERAQVLAEESKGKLTYSETLRESFRPQFVAEGMPAQSEHQIFKGMVAGVLFVQPKPCDRCPMPRVNQETGQLNPLDPNTVLSTYKLWQNKRGQHKPIFGENINPLGTGSITLGDEIVAKELRNPPLVYGGR
ncbi:MOSC domain-containing protein [Candidatus Roizmanbacteria bacterium]|nr:MOSC domain-containing protein [Candidatus Roizmanbacteria bacterium]